MIVGTYKHTNLDAVSKSLLIDSFISPTKRDHTLVVITGFFREKIWKNSKSLKNYAIVINGLPYIQDCTHCSSVIIRAVLLIKARTYSSTLYWVVNILFLKHGARCISITIHVVLYISSPKQDHVVELCTDYLVIYALLFSHQQVLSLMSWRFYVKFM